MVRRGGGLPQARPRDIPPGLRVAAEALQAFLEKAAERLREPTLAVDRVGDAGSPRSGRETGVPGHRAAGSGVAVEVERVAQREPRHVTQGLAGGRGRLPIDNPRDLA